MNINLLMFFLDTLMILFFVGIIAWAWSSRRKSSFDEASMIPLNDDGGSRSDSASERDHG